jgi:hypothetical protein
LSFAIISRHQALAQSGASNFIPLLFTNEGANVNGYFFMARTDSVKPAVILIHELKSIPFHCTVLLQNKVLTAKCFLLETDHSFANVLPELYKNISFWLKSNE